MPIEHRVEQGECISSIADQYGFAPDTLWNLAANRALRDLRKDPNVLLPGDVVVVPDKQIKQEDRPSDQRHIFRRRGVPERFRLRLMLYGQPRGNLAYQIEIEGRMFHGTTDADGVLEHWIPPGARRGRLILSPAEEYDLDFGHVDPIATASGVIGRLKNLGYLDPDFEYELDEDGEPPLAYLQAVAAFQQDFRLPQVNGVLDDATRARLVEAHGS